MSVREHKNVSGKEVAILSKKYGSDEIWLTQDMGLILDKPTNRPVLKYTIPSGERKSLNFISLTVNANSDASNARPLSCDGYYLC